MQFNVEKWETAYKKAASDLKGNGPSDGIVCVLATLRYIRDGVIAEDMTPSAEVLKSKPQLKDSVEYAVDALKAGLTELYETVNGAKTISGFASNASSAAKACELKSVTKSQVLADF